MISAPPLYLDNNATAPLRAAAIAAMQDAMGPPANPSSVHGFGRAARSRVEDARQAVAGLAGCSASEVVFTSGGTESSNLAILGMARQLRPQGRHIITSSVEHHAVLHPCEYLANNDGFEVTVLPVDAVGRVSPVAVRDAIRPDTVLVSIMAANNELGTIQPVAEIGEICSEMGVLFHSDAVQWFGKLPLNGIADFQADLVSLCAHKFHGPKGAGLLYAKSPLIPDPILHGGAQENERRAGSENLPAILGLAEAIVQFVPAPVFPMTLLGEWADLLIESVSSIEGAYFIGDRNKNGRLPNTVSFFVEESDSIALLSGLDLEGICASSGSACSSGSVTPSHVVKATGAPDSAANALVRFSLGRETSLNHVELVADLLPRVIAQARGLNK